MKSGLDMVKDGFTVLNIPALTDNISGNVYMLERPKNSTEEDVVINSLPITADQFQNGVFNVNIHVPNLNPKINGKLDDTIPNVPRLKAITDIVVKLLNLHDGFDFSFSLSNGGQPIRDTDLNWYFNIRVNYYAFQQNYLNI
jgi:hypothetical protein